MTGLFTFPALIVFGVFALRSTGGKKAAAWLLVALVVAMDAGAHAALAGGML